MDSTALGVVQLADSSSPATLLLFSLSPLSGLASALLSTTQLEARLLSLHAEMRYIDQLMPLFMALEHESRTPAAGRIAAGTSLLLALLVQVHRISQLSDSARTPTHYSISRKAQQIEKFRSLLDKHFRTEHSLQAYADLVGVSVGQLSRLCREVLGKSSLEVMNDRLIQEAQRELVYSKHTGVSPKAYRASALARMLEATESTH